MSLMHRQVYVRRSGVQRVKRTTVCVEMIELSARDGRVQLKVHDGVARRCLPHLTMVLQPDECRDLANRLNELAGFACSPSIPCSLDPSIPSPAEARA